jgi:Flp pilus assembly protein TadG
MRRARQRGGTLVEGTLALMVFALLVAGITELSVTGLAGNCVTFAAVRAARYASVRGSGSGHAATAADIQSIAQQDATPLSTGALTVTVIWTPDNASGSKVKVKVAYSFRPNLLPISATALTLSSTS